MHFIVLNKLTEMPTERPTFRYQTGIEWPSTELPVTAIISNRCQDSSSSCNSDTNSVLYSQTWGVLSEMRGPSSRF